MPLHALSDDERRSHCRREIETLEHWLRRLVHETFSAAYGTAYLDAVNEHGHRLFKSETASGINARRDREPSRYPRLIDAAHLDDLVRVVCKLENYQRHFKAALISAFPEGQEEARTFLNRLVEIRHRLSHANPITAHDAMRVICYTQDVLASLKEYYQAMNQQQEYNAPTIIRIADSQGHVRHASEIIRFVDGAGRCDFYQVASGRLYPADHLTIEAEVDPTFERSSYRVRWQWPGHMPGRVTDSDRVTLEIDNSHVRPRFFVTCIVTSDKSWHRLGGYDDMVNISYKVLAPVS